MISNRCSKKEGKQLSRIQLKHEAPSGGNKSVTESFDLSDGEEQVIIEEDRRIRAQQEHCALSQIAPRRIEEILHEIWAEEERACHHFFRTDLKGRVALCSFEAEEELSGPIADNESLNPLEMLEREEERERITSLLHEMFVVFPHLTQEQQEILREIYWEGERAAEISREKGVSRAAISRQHSRALATLLREMRKQDAGISFSCA